MTSADPRRPRTVRALGVVVWFGVAAMSAPVASAEVVRITSTPGPKDEDPAAVAVAAFPATAPTERLAGAPVAGLPDELSDFEAAPGSGPIAYVGASPVGSDADDPEFGAPRRPLAGLLPIAGGPVTTFTGPDGGPLGPDARGASNDVRPPWATWSADGASVVLHAFAPTPRVDPWFGAPRARRCVVATARCAAPVGREVVDLPGGGTVEVESGLVAPVGASRSLEPDVNGGGALARRLRTRMGRRYALTVRVAGRPGRPAAWTTTGALRTGAPAFDRAIPSAAGVLVRTSRVRAPRPGAREPYASVRADAGRAVIVRRDGTILPIEPFAFDVVGTLPDGRWILTGRPGRTAFEPGPTGQPLRALDDDGRITPITSGTRAITPVWAASLAGLPDSLSSTAEVERAGVDSATGLLVLAMRFDDDYGAGRVVAVRPDGTTPPRLLRNGPGRPSDDDYLVR